MKLKYKVVIVLVLATCALWHISPHACMVLVGAVLLGAFAFASTIVFDRFVTSKLRLKYEDQSSEKLFENVLRSKDMQDAAHQALAKKLLKTSDETIIIIEQNLETVMDEENKKQLEENLREAKEGRRIAVEELAKAAANRRLYLIYKDPEQRMYQVPAHHPGDGVA